MEAELDAFLSQFAERRTLDGRAAVVRNGHHPERAVQTGIGPVTVKVPKVRAKDGKAVTLPGIGKLDAAERAAREVRNPQTGEKKMADAHLAPRFKFSTTFKSAVRG